MANPVRTEFGKLTPIGTANLWVTEHGEIGHLAVSEHGELAFAASGALPTPTPTGSAITVIGSRRRRRSGSYQV